MSAEIQLRRPTESDHARLVGHVDEWWGGRRLHPLFLRLWFRHFSGTSWLAEDTDGRPAGFLVGFVSPDRPDEACIHMVATSPNHRRSGIARTLYERFFDDVRARGVRRVSAITWPGNRVSVDFHLAMGFAPSDGPGTQNLYGIAAYPDYDADGDDRVVFSREL